MKMTLQPRGQVVQVLSGKPLAAAYRGKAGMVRGLDNGKLASQERLHRCWIFFWLGWWGDKIEIGDTAVFSQGSDLVWLLLNGLIQASVWRWDSWSASI
jgi:hypothetical protein